MKDENKTLSNLVNGVCLIWAGLFQEKQKAKIDIILRNTKKNPRKMEIRGASVTGGIQDLFASLTGEEKQDILPNKRCCSVMWPDDR